MEEPGAIYFTGTAGAGKTSLVRAFADWMKAQGLDAATVNLDPGGESADLEPDIDIRDWVKLRDVMDEYGLGPNGAQVAAADLIALKIFEVKQALDGLRADLVFVDTPGQVELFAFRESSKAIVDALSGDRSMIAFLFDPALARSSTGFVTLALLSASVEFRFRLPTVSVLAKADLLTDAQREEILAWGEDPSRLQDAVTSEVATPDVQLSAEVLRGLETMAPLTTLTAVSAKAGTGIEDVYHAAMRNFAGGEDAEPSHGPVEE